MNQQQRKYAMQRMAELLRKKNKALKEEYKVPGKQLTWQEKIALVKRGKVSIRPKYADSTDSYARLNDLFDFSEHEKRESQRSGYTAALDKLEKKGKRICDELMLGDAEEAKRLIQEFEDSA